MSTHTDTTQVAWPQGTDDVSLGTAPPSAWTLTHLTTNGGTTLCGRTIPWDVAEAAPSHRGDCQRCRAADRRLTDAERRAQAADERAANRAEREAAEARDVAERRAADAAPECPACHARLELDALGDCFHCGAAQ